LKPFIAFFSLIFWLPYYRLKINKILSGAEKTNERLTFSGNFKNIALNTGLRVNIILLILTLLMVTMSILTLSTAKNKIISILAVLFFGVASASFFFSTRICLKYRGK
jgi:O-antigen ligase